MNTAHQAGLQDAHLDPDQLSAFLEGTLPEPERLATLRHMAECADCREAVFLTQSADPAFLQQTEPAAVPNHSAPRRWFSGSFGLLGTAALACCLAGVLLLQFHGRSNPQPHPSANPNSNSHANPGIAAVHPAEPLPPPPPVATPAPAKPQTAAGSLRQPRPAAVLPRPRPTLPAATANSSLEAPSRNGYGYVAGGVSTLGPEPLLSRKKAAQPGAPPPVVAGNSPAQAAAEGGSVAGPLSATAQLHSAPAAQPQTQSEARSPNPSLQGQAAGRALTPNGAAAPANDAKVESRAAPPAPVIAAQTVDVNAASLSVATEASEIAFNSKDQPDPLPSRLDSQTSIATPKYRLELDTADHLYRSRRGRHWKLIYPVWSGAIRSLTLVDAGDVQIVTTTGARWTSSDGRHWKLASP